VRDGHTRTPRHSAICILMRRPNKPFMQHPVFCTVGSSANIQFFAHGGPLYSLGRSISKPYN